MSLSSHHYPTLWFTGKLETRSRLPESSMERNAGLDAGRAPGLLFRFVKTFSLALCLVLYFLMTIIEVAQHFDRARIAYKNEATTAALRKLTGNPVPEETLSVLRRIDPSGYNYFQEGHLEASVLSADLFVQRLGKPYRHTMALTATPWDGQPIVFLNGGLLNSPVLQAVGFAHEIVHARHGDLGDPMSHHSAWRHLWMTEEGEAHLRQLRLSQSLHLPLRKPLSPAWIEYVALIYPFQLWLLFTVAMFLGWAWARADRARVAPYLRSRFSIIVLCIAVCGAVSSAFLPRPGTRMSLILQPIPTALCVLSLWLLLVGFFCYSQNIRFERLRRGRAAPVHVDLA